MSDWSSHLPVRSPLTCPILAGRGEELHALLGALDTTAGGRATAVCISGEAGAGKSRLVREAVRSASERGFQALTGGCTERDRDFPFGLFVDALRQRLMASGADPRELLGPHGAWLVTLLPELQRIYEPVDPDPHLTPEQGKRQRFEALAGALARLAARQPLLVVLEDVHWADPTSLELLELLPRRLVGSPVLLVMTARPDEIGERLRATLGALRRSRQLVDLALDPLPDADVRRMLDAMLPAGPAQSLEQVVLSHAGGNPFFVEEILATLAPAGGEWVAGEMPVPETVRDSVLRRIGGLPDAVQGVVRVLAVAGHQVRLDLLRAASDTDDDTLVEAITTLHERGLLLDGSNQQVVTFKHALTRDAILHGMSLAERRPLHQQVAAALEHFAGSGGPVVVSEGDLGYHFHAARVWGKALHYARAAGDAAWRMHATFEALGHYRRALDAALVLGDSRAAALHCRCGQALELLGGFESARDHFAEALRLARASGERATEQTALYEAAGLYASRDYRRAQQLAEQALELARAMLDQRREGLALNRLGNVLTNLEQFAGGLALHEQALARFDALGDNWGSADSHDLIAMTHYLSGDVPDARAACDRAAQMFADLDAPQRVASARTTQGMYLAVLDGPCSSDASPRVFREAAAQGLTLSRAIDWRAGEAYALVGLACAGIGECAYGNAATHLDAALAIAREIGHEQWTVIAGISYGILHADLFDDRRALAWFEQALTTAQRMGFAQWETRLLAWVARCRARLGDVSGAEQLLAPLLPEGAPESIRQRRALSTQAEIALLIGRPDDALSVVQRLLVAARGPLPAATVLLQARTLVELEHLDEARAAYREAARLAAEYGPRSVHWQATAGLARLPARDGARDSEAAALARGEVAAIAAALPDDWSATFLALTEASPWAKPVGSPARERGSPTTLTRREREVAALVSLGLTNRQIAGRLFIAEKTIEMHVSNCLGKLGFATRAQLAAWAVSQGIATPETTSG